MEQDDEPLFVVAIDFGTTYSGYAYCSKHDYKQDPPKVFAFENWVAGGQGLSKKTPTCLLLTPEKEFYAFGYEAENEYNALAASKKHKEWYLFKRFKMKLHGEEDIGDDFMIEDEMGKPLPAIDVFSVSIRSLKEHFLDQVQTHGLDVEENEIRWILTVPAIWSDSSKGFMRKAAVKAGLKARNLKIALEPEAASIFCQHLKTERSGPGSLCVSGPGTKYMVVDIGGGTADITVHEKLVGGKLRELYKASGGAWGGTAVDQQYFQLLTKIVGGPVMFEFQHKATSDYLDMMREFEVTKRNVNPKSRASVNVRVYASLDEICQKLNDENIGDIVSSSNFPYKGKIGGTADITVHEKLEGGKIKELYKASGGAWGGTAVDQQYIHLLTRIVGGPVMHRFQIEGTFEYLDMMREFEVTKRNVKPKGRTSVNVRLCAKLDEICEEINEENVSSIVSSSNFPYNGKIRKVADKLIIHMEIMQDLFKRVTDHIIEHVQKILRDKAANEVSLIILAGGFSESPIVQNTIRSAIKTEERRIIVSQESGLSVLKGTVIFGHCPQEIKSRMLRYTYGVEVKVPFKSGKHAEKRKEIVGGKEWCAGVFKTFVEIGTSVDADSNIENEYTYYNEQKNKQLAVYVSSDQCPTYVDENSCRCLKNIDIQSMIPRASMEKRKIHVTYTFGKSEVEIEIREQETGFYYNGTFDYASKE